jgi:hypothetical protein
MLRRHSHPRRADRLRGRHVPECHQSQGITQAHHRGGQTSKARTPEHIEAFAKLLQEKLATADIQARKAYLRAVIQEIRVDDHKIQIIGDKASLAAVIAGQQTAAAKVIGFVRKWRARQDETGHRYLIVCAIDS